MCLWGVLDGLWEELWGGGTARVRGESLCEGAGGKAICFQGSRKPCLGLRSEGETALKENQAGKERLENLSQCRSWPALGFFCVSCFKSLPVVSDFWDSANPEAAQAPFPSPIWKERLRPWEFQKTLSLTEALTILQTPDGFGTVITFILQMRKLRNRKEFK